MDMMGMVGVSAAAAYDADAQSYFDAMTVQPDATRKGVVNAYVLALKSAGIWSKLDLLYILACHDQQAGRLNVKNPAAFTLNDVVSSPTFATNLGFTSSGSNALDSTWVPSSNGVNYTQDDASLWEWSLSSGQSSSTDIGSVSAAPQARLIGRNTSDNLSIRINQGSSSVQSNSDGSGFLGGSRVSANTVRHWRNGAQLGTDISIASTGLPTQSAWVCGGNATEFSSRQLAIAAWGASLAGLEASFYSATLAYLQAIGAVP